MSGSLNKAQIIGHLGQDPEVRRTQDGRAVVTLSVATSERWKDRASGESREATEWHRVVIFNEALTKVAEQYLRKGSKVYIEGQIKTRKWQDQSGQDRYTTEIVLQSFGSALALLDKVDRPAPSEGDYGRPRTADARAGARHASAAAAAAQPEARNDFDDEIPF